jgi:hypothetical protein
LNYEDPFPRDSRYERVCDIMEVDITEFRVYYTLTSRMSLPLFIFPSHVSWVLTSKASTQEFKPQTRIMLSSMSLLSLLQC